MIWDEVRIIQSTDCVLFDEEDYYVELGYARGFDSSFDYIGYVSRQVATYFILVGANKEFIRVKPCCIRDGVALSGETNIVGRRLL